MRLLDKYLLKSHLFPLAFCLGGFGMLFVLYDLFDHMSKFLAARAPLWEIGAYYACELTPALEYLAPASLMLATLYTLWHLGRNSELVAMQAGGIGLIRIIRPIVAVGFAFALAVTAIREFAAAPADAWVRDFKVRHFGSTKSSSVDDLRYYNVPKRRLWEIGRFDPEHPTVLAGGVSIMIERADAKRLAEFRADKAEWLDGAWWFTNLSVQRYDASDHPVGAPVPVAPGAGGPVERRDFNETPQDFAIEARPLESLNSYEMWHYMQRQNPHVSRRTRAEREFGLHSRLATPWACLIATLFAIPVGARSSRQAPLSGVFKALAFFFAYYALVQVGVFIGRRHMVEPWIGAWLPNLVFLLSAAMMLFRLR